jgi:hypothetical protein
MDIEFKKCAVDGDAITYMLEVKCALGNLDASFFNSNTYDKRRAITEMVANKIASAVAEEYLKQHKADIMNAVNADDIYKGVQLKIVEGFSLQGR